MKIVFFGTPQFAATSLEHLLRSKHHVVLVVAQPDRPAGRGMKLQKPPVIQLAEQHGLETAQPAKIRDEAFISRIRELGADAGVVVAYGRILPAALLESTREGFLNVHGSILPKYRGAAPVQRAIEQGETETGVSIMKLDVDLDHGPVFSIATTPIAADERADALMLRLAGIGGAALVETLDAIEEGRAVATEQDHSAATFAPKIEKEESVVDWSVPAKRLYDRFRAFHPWPGLVTSFGGEVIKLTSIDGVDRRSGAAGEIVTIESDVAVIAAGEGSLVIRSMQRPGKAATNAADLLRGLRASAGMRFG